MLKLMLIMSNFMLMMLVMMYIYMNYSFCVMLEMNYMYVNLYLNYVSLWFIFLMGVMLFFLIYLLSKKYVSYTKYFYVTILYAYMFTSVVLMTIMEDFMCFMMLFESLFFPVCIVSLFFNFNNSFMFAIFYLIMFSSMSSMLCMMMCMVMMAHFNMLNLQTFVDICYFDSIYLAMFMWMMLFMMFAIKYPMWPLHIWLPEMHVEVNTEMSVLLASVVLKMGFFGVFKFLFLAFTTVSLWFLGFVDSVVMLGLTFLALSLLFLADYKKVMANWSVMHTGVGLMLLWHNDMLFVGLLMFCNLAHMLSSSFMFITIGYMYDNYGVRMFLLMMSFFGMSMWSSLFLTLFLFNIDFPFMLLFYMDMFVLYGLLSLSYMYMMCFYMMTLSVFVSSIYMYMCMSFYSFLWLDKYMRLDLCMNDIYFHMLCASMTSIFYYVMYLLF